MSSTVLFDRDGDVAIISINNPPLNLMSSDIMRGLMTSFALVREEFSVKAVVVIGIGKTFISGANIRDFDQLRSAMVRRLGGPNALMTQIEDCPKPVVCAISGNALGIGLEFRDGLSLPHRDGISATWSTRN